MALQNQQAENIGMILEEVVSSIIECEHHDVFEAIDNQIYDLFYLLKEIVNPFRDDDRIYPKLLQIFCNLTFYDTFN